MKNVVIFVTAVVVFSFLGFLVWMNVTSGYFQQDCKGVGYQKRGYFCQILPKPFTPTFTDKFLLWVANGDLYR